jgi:NIMA (never in mitosis gene a)-related kinase 1/4/5
MRLYHGTLHQEISRRQAQEKMFSAPEVARLTMDIVTGLSMLHTRKLLHRDLKSDNIFLTFDGTRGIAYLTLGDFDSAKQISSDSVAHTVIGTPGYMAPEILLNQKYGFPADIFALGMILYELLSLQRPFSEERNAFKISQMIIEGKRPTVPEQLGPEFASLVKLQKKCVHPKPERRPSLANCKSALVKHILNSDSSFSGV